MWSDGARTGLIIAGLSWTAFAPAHAQSSTLALFCKPPQGYGPGQVFVLPDLETGEMRHLGIAGQVKKNRCEDIPGASVDCEIARGVFSKRAFLTVAIPAGAEPGTRIPTSYRKGEKEPISHSDSDCIVTHNPFDPYEAGPGPGLGRPGTR